MDIHNDFGITVKLHPLDFYQNLIETNVPFTFTCWGDGEWQCAMKNQGQTKSGQIYFENLANDLENIIKNKPLPYFHATDDFSFELFGSKIRDFLNKNNFNVEWHNWRTFRYAAEDTNIYQFLKATKKINKILIGPEYLRNTYLMTWDGFVSTPEKNSYLDKERIEEEILSLVNKLPQPLIIYFSIGLAAPVIQNNLFPIIGDKVSMIDFGSIFDGLLGLKKRLWHSKVKQEITLL